MGNFLTNPYKVVQLLKKLFKLLRVRILAPDLYFCRMAESNIVYECAKCHKTFDRQERLEKHKVKSCDGIQCNICSKKFHSHQNLNKHKIKHRSCDACFAEFCGVAAYKQHMRTEHTIKDPQNLFCQRCNQRFDGQQRLDTHTCCKASPSLL